MVEYFGQSAQRFPVHQERLGAVYGTRCVKPPIVWGDVSRANPITVEWSAYAQSHRSHVMSMLTGRSLFSAGPGHARDITHEQQTQQLALAIRDEVLDLEAAGIKVIQIDEAALREAAAQEDRLAQRSTSTTGPFRRSVWCTPRSKPTHADPHPHVLFGFNDIITDIDAMDADVISFEASRGIDLVVLDAIHANFETEAGPASNRYPLAAHPVRSRDRGPHLRNPQKMDVERCGSTPTAV